MAENICLMFTESDVSNTLIKVLSLAAAAVDLHKRTVLYVGGRWADIAQPGELERRDRELKGLYKGTPLVELFQHFLSGGGQVWVSAFNAQQMDLNKYPLIPGAFVVDDHALLTFLTQDTVVLNF